MAESEVKANDPVKEAGEKKASEKPGDKKKSNFWAKYKIWVAGGAAIVLAIFWLMSRGKSGGSGQSQAAQQQQYAAQNGINPATGYLYGSPADVAALGGSGSVTATPGPRGPAGPRGKPGARGPAGRPSEDHDKDKGDKHPKPVVHHPHRG